MPYLLIAKVDTYLKADAGKHSRDQSDADKIRISKGDVVEAAQFPLEGGWLMVRDAVLKGNPVPSHITYALAGQWSLEEAPEKPAEASPAATASAPAAKPAPAAAAQPTAEGKMAEAKAMLAAGKSVSAIAKELRIGRASIKRWRDEA